MSTKIINCMQHMHLPITDRPVNCELCATDQKAAGVEPVAKKPGAYAPDGSQFKSIDPFS